MRYAIHEEIDKFLDKAEAAKAKRDKCKYDTQEYWKYHDAYLEWESKAEALMPGPHHKTRVDNK